MTPRCEEDGGGEAERRTKQHARKINVKAERAKRSPDVSPLASSAYSHSSSQQPHNKTNIDSPTLFTLAMCIEPIQRRRQQMKNPLSKLFKRHRSSMKDQQQGVETSRTNHDDMGERANRHQQQEQEQQPQGGILKKGGSSSTTVGTNSSSDGDPSYTSSLRSYQGVFCAPPSSKKEMSAKEKVKDDRELRRYYTFWRKENREFPEQDLDLNEEEDDSEEHSGDNDDEDRSSPSYYNPIHQSYRPSSIDSILERLKQEGKLKPEE
jgi:hypothetical protein